MKNLLICIIATLGTTALIAQDGCNAEEPGWGKRPGRISFKTRKTWTIGKQTWSDAVVVASCNKTTYGGGTTNNYVSDCKRNPDNTGDLFSWCAVTRYKTQICPRGWNMPTTADFIELEQALKKAHGKDPSQTKYTLWGCSFEQSCCDAKGNPVNQGSYAFYWSSTEFGTDHGSHIGFNISDDIYPQSNSNKGYGFMVRCVR